jgi:HEAT repeat protein
VIISVGTFGFWWRTRESQKYWADGPTSAVATSPVASNLSIDELIDKLGSTSTVERNGAAEALGRLGEPAVPALIKVLKDDDASIRRYAALALARIGPQAALAVPALIERLDDSDLFVLQNTLFAFKQIGPAAEPAVGAIQSTLQQPAVSIRRSAVESLGAIGRAGMPSLLEALRDDDRGVRVDASLQLIRIDPQCCAALPVLCEGFTGGDQETRDKVLRVFLDFGVDAVPTLVKALRDDEKETVRYGATRALQAIKATTEDTVPALIEATKDESRLVRSGAVHALGELAPASKQTVRALRECLGDEDGTVRFFALRTLQQMGVAPKQIDPEEADNAGIR